MRVSRPLLAAVPNGCRASACYSHCVAVGHGLSVVPGSTRSCVHGFDAETCPLCRVASSQPSCLRASVRECRAATPTQVSSSTKTVCEHGNWRNDCRHCSPRAWCSHSRRKRTCAACSPQLFCAHARLLTRSCTECARPTRSAPPRVASVPPACVHGLRRARCAVCARQETTASSPKCEHGRRNYRCKLCRAASGLPPIVRRSRLCVHGIGRRECAICGKCEHSRWKHDCRECTPGAWCEHGRRRKTCLDCEGTCEHDRRRTRCRICSPSAYCAHGRLKKTCRACSPARFCRHGARMGSCRRCKRPSAELESCHSPQS